MIVAERNLKLIKSGEDIPIVIFTPREADGSWFCKFTIGWPDGEIAMDAGGIDSVQAIELAFKMIGAFIYSSDHHASGELVWLEVGKGYGFPVTKDLRDLLVGEDRKFF